MNRIQYNDKNKIFHLRAKDVSYIIQVYREGYLGHIYWGKEVNAYHGSFPLRFADRAFSPNPDKDDRTFSLDTMPREYPAYGNTDFRTPAIQLMMPDGDHITDFRYKSHRIVKGKPALEGLPHTYVEEPEEAETLVITMKDSLHPIEMDLMYTVYADWPVVVRSVKLYNNMSESLKIQRIDSFNIDYRSRDFKLLHLPGAWGREREVDIQTLHQGVFNIESRRGASSHQHNPFFALLSQNATEDTGDVYGFSYVYSGSFLGQVEVDSFRNTRVHMGLNPFNFEWLLGAGEAFQSPEAVMVYSDRGIGHMSRAFHGLYRKRLIRGTYREKVRPILINNWEATYFSFDEDKLLALADRASSVGIELFVLDDGWFGKRDDDKTSLGDWFVNEEKLPNGLAGLVKEVNEKELSFGIWVEPEMVSVESDLYKEHSDWCLHVGGRRTSESRNQLVLDFSRDEVCIAIEKMLMEVLASAPIEYVKWDMNRHMTEAYSAALPKDRKKETMHRYILGLYGIMERLTAAFPDILFESCSGGGGRFDPGMLYYMPQTWTSDDTDAVERLKIQYGTSIVYPIISMGSHVSDIPNHQVHRKTPMAMRADVAMAGNLGYELDLTKVEADELQAISKQVKRYKEWRHIVQLGDFYRLISPFESNDTSWMFISDDRMEVLVFYYKKLAYPQESFVQLKLKGLSKDRLYMTSEGDVYGGDELMNIGIPIPVLEGDFKSCHIHLKKI